MDTELANAALIVDDIWTQNSKFRRDKSLKLISKIYKNIKTHPNDAKFRRLNISKIMSKPDIIPQTRQILLISGFKANKNGIHIDLNDSNLSLCLCVGDMIEKRIKDEINKLSKERERIKKETKEKQRKYLEKANKKKNKLMNKIENEKKDIEKEKELGFKVIQNKNTVSTKKIYPEICEDRSNKTNFVKDPDIMAKSYNIIIEYWWNLSEIYIKKDVNINRMIIIFTMNAFRLILTKDKEYYDNTIRRRQQMRLNATNNRDISIKINQRKRMVDFEREELYQKLTNNIYKTQTKYNETRLPIPVSGINFNKEYVVLITNKSIYAQLMQDYEIQNNGKCIVFTVYVDMLKMMMDNNNNIYNNNRMHQIYNNLWCVAIPTLFKFEKIGIKTMVKRVKQTEEDTMIADHNDDDDIDDDEDDDYDYDDPMNDHMIGNMMGGGYGYNMVNAVNDEYYNDNDDNVRQAPTEIVQKIIYIHVKSGKVETDKGIGDQ